MLIEGYWAFRISGNNNTVFVEEPTRVDEMFNNPTKACLESRTLNLVGASNFVKNRRPCITNRHAPATSIR